MDLDTIELDLSKYVRIVRDWLPLLVTGALVAGVLGWGISRLQPTLYEAEANVASVKSFSQISLSPDYKTLSEAQLTQGLDVSARQRALIAIARGAEIASAVIAEMGPTLSPAERQVGNLVGMSTISADGDLIKIKVQNRDPQRAATIANTWARIYADRVNQLYTEAPMSPDQLRAQKDQAWAAYQDAEKALSQFIGQSRIDRLAADMKAKQNKIDDLYATQRAVERLIQDAQSLQDLIGADPALASNDVSSRLAVLLVRANAVTLSSAQSSASANAAQSSASSVSSGQGGTGALGSSQSLQLQIAPSLLTDTAQPSVRLQVESLIAALQARKKNLDAQIADTTLSTQILALQQEQEQQLARKQELATARDVAWGGYKTVLSKLEEVQLTQEGAGTIVRVSALAIVPELPLATRATTNGLIAAVAAFLVLLIAALAVELLNPAVKSSKELVDALHLPIYEIQPEDVRPLGAPLGGAAGQVPQPFYRIWANLFLSARTSAKTMLIAGTNSDCAAGVVAANLGIISAQSGRSVILADADWLNPSLAGIFGLRNTSGWCDLLADREPNVKATLQPTAFKNLAVITSGSGGPMASADMVSPQLGSTVQALAGMADLVIFVAPSLMRSADVLLIGKHVQAVVLAATAQSTLQDQVVSLKEQLANVGANVSGVFLFGAKSGPSVWLRRLLKQGPPKPGSERPAVATSLETAGKV